MEEIFKNLMVEWQHTPFPSFIHRSNEEYLHQSYANIYAIIGPRRAGKTYFLYQIIQHLIDTEHYEKKDFLFVDFEDIALQGIDATQAMTMLKSYRSIYQQDPKFLVFDEIQTLQNWSHFLRTLHNKKYQIIITGSSSKLLLNEIATELRGRYSHTLILPFSFPEYLEYKGIDLNNLSYLSQTGVIDGAFTEYMQYGGFPAIINEEASQKRKMLMEYYDTIYYKDILERYTIRDKRLVENFMKYLLDMYSSILSPAKLADYLKKEGKGGSKTTLSRYISYFKEAFFLLECNKFGYSPKAQFINSRKMYLIDPGFTGLGLHYSENKGLVLENIVAIELFRREKEFYYYLEGKRECDFLVKDHTSQPIQEAIQVTWELNFSSETREIEGLIEAMKKCHLSEGFILTYNQKKELNVEGYQIHMLPLLERLR